MATSCKTGILRTSISSVLGMGNLIENRFLTPVSDAYGSKDEVKVISFLPSRTSE